MKKKQAKMLEERNEMLKKQNKMLYDLKDCLLMAVNYIDNGNDMFVVHKGCVSINVDMLQKKEATDGK